jgi:hypothetical protein
VYAVSSWKVVKKMAEEQKNRYRPLMYPYEWKEGWINLINIGPGPALKIEVGAKIDNKLVTISSISALTPLMKIEEIGHRFQPNQNIREIIVIYQDIFSNKYETQFQINNNLEIEYSSVKYLSRN